MGDHREYILFLDNLGIGAVSPQRRSGAVYAAVAPIDLFV
jgi:hypothetical protein